MLSDTPSRTALGVAVQRAIHQQHDVVKVFDDPLAERIIKAGDEKVLQYYHQLIRKKRLGARLRAFLAARSRYAEDCLHQAVRGGVRQYVLLGAGFDTFAYRMPYSNDELTVFEVDHPASQAFKKEFLAKAEITVPEAVRYVAVDFENDSIGEKLNQAGFHPDERVVFSWLGVSPYLLKETFWETLVYVASMTKGSEIVFDYMISPEKLNPVARYMFNRIAKRVGEIGEPFQSFYSPEELENGIMDLGYRTVEDLGPEDLCLRYFPSDKRKAPVGVMGHLVRAIL